MYSYVFCLSSITSIRSVVDGGATFKSFRALVFDVFKLLYYMCRRGPGDDNGSNWLLYMSARKALTPLMFALGMKNYAIHVAFDCILWLYLYVKNEAMSMFARKFFVLNTKSGLEHQASYKGTDEFCEERGKQWKSIVSGRTHSAFQQAVKFMGFFFAIKKHLLSYIGIHSRPHKQRADVSVVAWSDKIVQFLNHYQTAKRRTANDALYGLYSFDFTEIHPSENGVDQLLITGWDCAHAWVRHLRDNGGDSLKCEATALNVDDDNMDFL